ASMISREIGLARCPGTRAGSCCGERAAGRDCGRAATEAAMATARSGQSVGIGASLLRKEDDRHLRGRGEFVSDIRLPGTMEVAFLRSPHAHARIKSIEIPPEHRGRVFTAADLPRLQPIRVVTQAAG